MAGILLEGSDMDLQMHAGYHDIETAHVYIMVGRTCPPRCPSQGPPVSCLFGEIGSGAHPIHLHLKRNHRAQCPPPSAPFEVASFEVASFEVASFEAASFEVASFEVASFEVAPFEVASFEVASFEASPSKVPKLHPSKLPPSRLPPSRLPPPRQLSSRPSSWGCGALDGCLQGCSFPENLGRGWFSNRLRITEPHHWAQRDGHVTEDYTPHRRRLRDLLRLYTGVRHDRSVRLNVQAELPSLQHAR